MMPDDNVTITLTSKQSDDPATSAWLKQCGSILTEAMNTPEKKRQRAFNAAWGDVAGFIVAKVPRKDA